MKLEDQIIVGDIVNTHGLRGELKVLSDSDFKKERFMKGNTFYILDKAYNIVDHVTLMHHRTYKNFDLLTFQGKQSIDDVVGYKGFYLAINKQDARPLDADEGYYHAEIMASDVYDEGATFIGRVYKIIATPAYDLWYIKRKGQKDLIVPFTDHFVKKINVAEKKIIIHLIEGMI